MLRRRTSLICLLLIVVAGCRTAPSRPEGPVAAVPESVLESYLQIPAKAGQVFLLDEEASEVRIYVYRGGPLAARGHNHVLTAGDIEGAVFLPSRGPGQAQLDIVIPVRALQVDEPVVRQAVGGSFGGEVSAEARTGTRDNMLASAVLDADRYPRIGIRSMTVAGELPKLVVDAAITLRGVTRRQLVPVDVRMMADGLIAEGAMAIRQEDFGITPLTVLGGLLSVQGPLTIEFRLVGRPQG